MRVGFRREMFVDRQLNTLQDNVEEVFSVVNEMPMMDGKMFDVAFDVAEPKTFRHGLKRTPIGVMPCLTDADGAVVFVVSMDTERVTLDSNLPCNVKVWVF